MTFRVKAFVGCVFCFPCGACLDFLISFSGRRAEGEEIREQTTQTSLHPKLISLLTNKLLFYLRRPNPVEKIYLFPLLRFLSLFCKDVKQSRAELEQIYLWVVGVNSTQGKIFMTTPLLYILALASPCYLLTAMDEIYEITQVTRIFALCSTRDD